MAWIGHSVKEEIKITEIYTFFRNHYSCTYEFQGETHNFWELMYVIEGSLCVSADEKVYNLSAGELIFHKPLELHKFHITSAGGAAVMVFSYSAEGDLCKFFRDKVFMLTPSQKSIIAELLDYAEVHSENSPGAQRQYSRALGRVEMYSHNVSLRIVQLMLSLAENSSILPVSKASDSVIFTNAVKYMSDLVYENPSLDEISRHVNLSVSSVKRIFNRYAGMGVHKYFLKLKLKAAIELLSAGCTVTFVAEKLNFSSQGYFTKVFKRETGMLPSEVGRI